MRRGLVVVAAASAAALIYVLVQSGGSSNVRCDAGSVPANPRTGRTSEVPRQQYVYPLKVSQSGRYVVDQRNVPFLIVGDSPQSMVGNVSVADAATYIANRKAAGFNSLWVNLLCVEYTACRSDGKTFDGISPFTTPGDLSTPNEAYFARADAMIAVAAKHGMVVFLDPIETGGWLETLRKNGLAKAYAYGRYLGARYKNVPNLVWFSGNDYQTWEDAADDSLVLAVARGIRASDHAHLHTIELNFPSSGSLDDRRWRSLIGLDAAYTYAPTYVQLLREYNRSKIPVFMVEAVYEFENLPGHSPGTPQVLRQQDYWSFLSGSTGQFYGNKHTWQFLSDWKENINTLGSCQLRYAARLFAARPWFRLVPDQGHRLVTSGYGSFSSGDYMTAAATPDGRLAIAYLPSSRTISLDLRRLSGSVRAQWYDPTTGTFSDVSGSPFPNSGTREFTPPGENGDGDTDWALVLTARGAKTG